MNKTKSEFYPNIESAEDIGGMKQIVRLPNMSDNAPEITWGKAFETWPMVKRMRYAMRLASAMNHAADVCQQERNKLLVVAKHQEKQLEHLQLEHNTFNEVINARITTDGIATQKLYEQIEDLTIENSLQKRILNAALKSIEGANCGKLEPQDERIIKAIRKLRGD